MKYMVLPLGCQMNRSDTERVRTVLNSMGFEESEFEDDPDLAIKGIIACSVRQKAVDRVYGKIRNWNASKGKALTFLSGCFLPVDGEKFETLFDFVFPIDMVSELPEMIRERTKMAGAVSPPSDIYAGSDVLKQAGIESFWQLRPSYSSKVEAFIPIQSGCNKFCSFCAVPYTRGREISRLSANILAELTSLLGKNYRSLTLLGQNVNSYGLDKGNSELNFAALMRSIGRIGRETGKDFWTYFTSPHPRDMSGELIDVIAEYDVLAKQIHLPLQSGDNEVLHRMNRSYSLADYREVVHGIRRILPEATLSTDIIVGFCGETDAQFERTLEAMREFQFDMAYIAKYNPRPGAVSARWADDVGREVKERRFVEAGEVLRQVASRKNKRMLASEQRVLLCGRDERKGYLFGYTEGKIPVRLGLNTATMNGEDVENRGEVGEFTMARITSTGSLSVEGRVL